MTEMSLSRPELSTVYGVAESAISDSLAQRMGPNIAPAPWSVTCQAIVWGHRANADAAFALPPLLRQHAKPLAVAGGLVHYLDTPVGAYDEVFGIVVSRLGRRVFGTVVFMAVDSEKSLVGGRTNWAMPKTLAKFTGDVRNGMTASSTETGMDWLVAATPRVLPFAIPSKTGAQVRQLAPGHLPDALWGSKVTGRFAMRPAKVRVDVNSQGTLPKWLRPGTHLGGVAETMTFSLTPSTATTLGQ